MRGRHSGGLQVETNNTSLLVRHYVTVSAVNNKKYKC